MEWFSAAKATLQTNKKLLLERNCQFVVINKAAVIMGRWTLHHCSSRSTGNTLKRYQWVSKENFISAPCRDKNWSTRDASRNGENLNYQCSPFDPHQLLLNHLLQQWKYISLLHPLYFSFPCTPCSFNSFMDFHSSKDSFLLQLFS